VVRSPGCSCGFPHSEAARQREPWLLGAGEKMAVAVEVTEAAILEIFPPQEVHLDPPFHPPPVQPVA
jgi:hypothetical protein